MTLRVKDLVDTKSAAGKLDVKNVIYPLLWLAFIGAPISLLLALFSSGFKTVAFFIFAFICIVPVIYFYGFFAKTNPDYLRSEKFQFQRLQLTTLGEKAKDLDLDNAGNNSEIPIITQPQPLISIDTPDTDK